MIEEIIAKQKLSKDEFISIASLDDMEMEFALAKRFVNDKYAVHDAFVLSDKYYVPSRLGVEYRLQTLDDKYFVIARYKKE